MFWCHFTSSNFYNNERASNVFRAIQCRVGGNMPSQTHHNSVLQKGKAIALNSAEINIVIAFDEGMADVADPPPYVKYLATPSTRLIWLTWRKLSRKS